MRPQRRIRSFLLAGLLAVCLPSNHSWAVTISLVPDGPTTIEVGETVNVDVFLVLDAADQAVGIAAATLHLELGAPFVDVVASSGGSVFPVARANVVPERDLIAFSQFGVTVTSPTALLGSLSITGKAPGSYDLVGRRFSNFPQFTPPGLGAYANRYDFASDETLRITVPCGGDACEVASPNPIEPSDPDRLVSHHNHRLNPHSSDVFYTLAGGGPSIETLTSTTQLVPEPHTFALLGLALTGLMLLRSPRRKRSKRSPGS